MVTDPVKPETFHAFNGLLMELWPHLSSTIAQTTKEKMKELLEISMNQKKPTAVVFHFYSFISRKP